VGRLAHRFFYIIPPPYIFRKAGESRLRYYFRKYLKRRVLPPTGGVKIILQHCDFLNKQGYQAFPVHAGNFTVGYHEHATPHITLKQALKIMREEDIVIIPEMMPYVVSQFKCKTRISLVQQRLGNPPDFQALGYTHILCISDLLLQETTHYSALPKFLVMNGIDLSAFKPDPAIREVNRVIFLNFKNADLANRVVGKLNPEIKNRVNILGLDAVYKQHELIEQFQRTDVFMATAFPEGFSLPPLEAMACGCAVVGCTGGGAGQYMHDNKTALVVPDGDVDQFVKALEAILTDNALKERIREAGIQEAKNYSVDRMERELLVFAEKICAEASSS